MPDGCQPRCRTVGRPTAFDSLVSLWVKKRTSYQRLLDDLSTFVHRDPEFPEDMDLVLDQTLSEWIERQYGGCWATVSRGICTVPFCGEPSM